MLPLLGCACMALSALAAVWLWRLNTRISVLAEQLARTAAVRAEAQLMREANQRLAQWQDVTETSIDSGTAAVRAIHRGIAAIPFDILEAIPATRDTGRVLRGVHDFTSDNVYSAISLVNRLAGQRGRRILNRGQSRDDDDQNRS